MLTLAAGSSHLYHVDSFNSRKLKEVHGRVMEDTNVSPWVAISNPGSQSLSKHFRGCIRLTVFISVRTHSCCHATLNKKAW